MNIKYVNLADILDDAAGRKATVSLNGDDYWVKRGTSPYNDGWSLDARKKSSWFFIHRAEWKEEMEWMEITDVEYLG